MMMAADAGGGAATFRAVQRRLAELLPDAAPFAGSGALELTASSAQDRPRLDPPELLEDGSMRSHAVGGAPVVRFAAFLDGTQTSRVVRFIGGVPIVHGSVAAVVRGRRDRRMTTWRAPLVRRRLYAPMSLLPPESRDALAASGAELVDTSARGSWIRSIRSRSRTRRCRRSSVIAARSSGSWPKGGAHTATVSCSWTAASARARPSPGRRRSSGS